MDAASLILLQTPRAPAAAEAPRRDSAAFDRALDNAVADAPGAADGAGGAHDRKTDESFDGPAAGATPETSEQPAQQPLAQQPSAQQQPAQQQPAPDGTPDASSATAAQTPAAAVPPASTIPVPALVAGLVDLASAASGAASQVSAAQGVGNAAGAPQAPGAANPLNGFAQAAGLADAAGEAAPVQPAQTAQSQQTTQGQQTAQAVPSQPATEAAPAAPQQGLAQTQPQAQPQHQVSAQSQTGAQPQTMSSTDGVELASGSQNTAAQIDPRGNAAISAMTSVPASATSAAADGSAAPAATHASVTSLRAAAAEAEQGRPMRAGKGAASVTAAAAQQTGAAQPQSQSQTQSANAAQPPQGTAPDIRIVAAQAGADTDAGLETKPVSVDTFALRSEHGHRTETSAINAAHAADRSMPRMDAAAIVRLAQQIGARAGEGANRFEIRMDPPELGRVDVRLRIDSENRAHAVLLAERADTLSDLSRAARALERALEDAGLKLAQNGLEFGLKRDAPQQDQSRGGSPYALADLGEADAPASIAPASALASGGEGHVTAYYGFKVAHAARLAVSI